MDTIRYIYNIINSFVTSNSNFDFNTTRIKTNYECEVCRSTGRPPNMLGKFIKINDEQSQCNGCGTTYQVVQPVQLMSIPVAQCVMVRD
jgi:hypothetical protein